MKKDKIGVALSADIWGENGISLLGVMGYWIDEKWQLHEKLLMSEPFGKVGSLLPFALQPHCLGS